MPNLAGALAALSLLPLGALAHLRISHPSMYGYNVTDNTFNYDNRPEVPLMYRDFDQWWFHGHINYPPHPHDVFEFPAGGSAVLEIGCNKAWSSYYKTDPGQTDLRDGSNRPCGRNAPNSALHAVDINDVAGCAIGIVDKANPHDIKPEDFAIFSTKHQCPWYNVNEFQVPENMPSCSQGVCHCAWFWIHSPNSGSMQMYMNAFRCKITNTKSTAKKIGTPKVARRCGHDPVLNRNGDPKNCTVGAKQPLYWLQNERNNMFEGYYDPPFYNDLYGYKEGAQNDIFVNEQGNYEGGVQAAGAVHKTTTTHKTTHKTTTTHHKTTTTHHKTTTTHHHKTTTTTAKHSSCTKGSTDKKCKKKSHAKRNGDVPNVF